MVAAGNRVVGAGDQQRPVAAAYLQVGQGEAAVEEREVRRQGDRRRDVESAEPAGVFEGRRQAHEVAAVDAGDRAVDGRQVGDAAGERRVGGAGRRPRPGGSGNGADTACGDGDDAVANREGGFGDRLDDGGALRDELLLDRDRGQLRGLPEQGQRALVGEGQVADRQRELDFDAAAGERRGRVVSEAEEDGVAGVGTHRIDGGRIGVGVAGAVVPLPGAPALAPADAGQVEQRQREVGAQGEVFVVAGGEVIGQAEGDDVAGTQFPVHRRRAAIDRQ